MTQEPQSMAQAWTEDEGMVQHAIIDFYDFYPSARAEDIDISIIQEFTGLSYEEVYEAQSALERKGVIHIENGTISLIKHEGYHPKPMCFEQEWQTVLLQVKDLRERLGRILPTKQTARVHVRGRIGWWTMPTAQNALRTVEKYRLVPVTMRENLLFAQALLWQVAVAVEAIENGQEMGTSVRGLVPKPDQDAPSTEKGRTQ